MKNPMDMTGRRVMVTGASSGLGRAAAILLSELGAHLVLVARNRDRLEHTRRQLAGDNHHIFERDLGADIDGIPRWIKAVTNEAGSLHGMVHSAGSVAMLPLRVLSLNKLNNLMDINFNSAVLLARGFRQRSVVADHGSIVFVSSVAGILGQSGLAAYCASKGALNALTRSLALELADEGIRINSVAPGLVGTEMVRREQGGRPEDKISQLVQRHPLGLGRPDDVANAIAFLLADASRWITGSTLVVDGGYLANGT